MNKHLWVTVSMTLLSSIQAVAGEVYLGTIEHDHIQSIERTVTGNIILVGKNGQQIEIDRKLVEALKNVKLDSAPNFERSSPCVVLTK